MIEKPLKGHIIDYPSYRGNLPLSSGNYLVCIAGSNIYNTVNSSFYTVYMEAPFSVLDVTEVVKGSNLISITKINDTY